MDTQRRLRFGVALAALTGLIIIAAVGPSTAAADDPPGCADGKGCMWGQDNFNGNKITANCWETTSDVQYHSSSAKNRCGHRKMTLVRLPQHTGESAYAIACLDPGENRPDPGWFDVIYFYDGSCGG